MTAPAAYEVVNDAGSAAPWLTLVHGATQHRGVFSAQVAAFRADFRLLLIDLPGHGLSAALPGPFGMEEYAASVRAAMEEATWEGGGETIVEGAAERTHYWATHTGTGVGLLLAAREPERFASLVLEGPVFPDRQPLYAVEMIAQVRRLAAERGLEAARRHWWEQSDWFEVMRDNPEVCRAAGHLAMVSEFRGGPWLDTQAPARIAPIDGQLAELELPVLIVNGEHEVADFVAAADELSSLLPNARRAVIADAGGFPLWEFPDRVNAEVRRFLSG
ncbi:MAG: alpha/beta fold hydrolase [bacterium]